MPHAFCVGVSVSGLDILSLCAIAINFLSLQIFVILIFLLRVVLEGLVSVQFLWC